MGDLDFSKNCNDTRVHRTPEWTALSGYRLERTEYISNVLAWVKAAAGAMASFTQAFHGWGRESKQQQLNFSAPRSLMSSLETLKVGL